MLTTVRDLAILRERACVWLNEEADRDGFYPPRDRQDITARNAG